ncbi:MAG TPA: hypothetical protein VF635_17060 [Propionibacteriaceae bacterium]
MVALLVSLKLTLLRNSLRRSAWRTVGLVIGLLYALGAVVAALVGLAVLRDTSLALTADVTVVAFSLLTVGWLLLSLLVYGTDETVDPSKFALLPVRARSLLPGLFVAGLIGSPGVATLLVSAGLVVTWARSPALTLAAIIAFPVGLATCCLMARAATSACAAFLASRRFRDFAFVVLGLVTAGVALGLNLLGSSAVRSGGRYREALADGARIIGWTPFGWAWSVPAEVARGQWLLAGVRLVLALVLVAVLWLTWEHFLARRLVEPVEAGGAAAKARPGSFVERLYPRTPAGAVAERTLRYWRRDPRYLAGVIGILLAPAIVLVTQLANPDGPPVLAAFTSVILAGLIGISVAADLSYDGTAVWVHISAGLSGADDRAGRVLSALTIFGPLLVVLSVVSLAVVGQWRLWLPVTALTVGLTLISLGAGAYVGALWQWPAPPPGANPFQNGSSGGLPSLLSFLLTSTATTLLALPTIALVIASSWWPWLGWLALVVGLVSGFAVLRAGIRWGGTLLDRRWPEVMASVSQSAG